MSSGRKAISDVNNGAHRSIKLLSEFSRTIWNLWVSIFRSKLYYTSKNEGENEMYMVIESKINMNVYISYCFSIK